MAVPCTRRLLLIGLLLVLAADSAFGRFLPAAVEQHNLRFKRGADDIFLRDTKDWSKYGIATGVYLVISLVIYVATFCCALEKKCAAAAGPPPSASATSLGPASSVASSASTRTAKGPSPSEASMRTALQQSIRMDSRTQRETERAAASSRKSGKVSPSTRLPTASAKEQTASRKTTSARTSSARTASAGTTSKKSTSKATKSKKGTSSKGTTDTGKSTSGSARSTSGGSGKAAANHLVPVPSTPKLPVALPAVRMRVQLAVDLIVLVEKDRRKRKEWMDEIKIYKSKIRSWLCCRAYIVVIVLPKKILYSLLPLLYSITCRYVCILYAIKSENNRECTLLLF
ncbi:unnamed protein product [Meloidogyne enterolobii]|uniref:Uncharacterized protein n=1 Tax=Meloidogyne enterolobii TaxID=390850 RepID=A0ACB0YYT3_MELEN